MTEKDLAHNLISIYVNLKSANENIKAIWDFRSRIHNPELIDVIKQTKPKINFFINTIEKTFLQEPNFKTKHFEDIEEKCNSILEQLDHEIRKL